MSLPKLAVIVGKDRHARSEYVDPNFSKQMQGIVELVSLEEAKMAATSSPVVGLAALAHAPV